MNFSMEIVESLPERQGDLVILAFKAEPSGRFYDSLPGSIKNDVLLLLKEQPEILEWGKSFVLSSSLPDRLNKTVVAGLGDLLDCTEDKLRQAAGNIARLCETAKMRSPVFIAPDFLTDKAAYIRALAEGLYLGGYVFEEYKSKKTPRSFVSASILARREMSDQVRQAAVIAGSVNITRDLVNRPGNVINPAALASAAQTLTAGTGIRLTVLEQTDMEAMGMGALLSVSRGSAQPPKLLVLEYTGDAAQTAKTAFVGKGVTFDSGGISLKPSEGMGDMKDDMGGAAAVLGAVCALARLAAPVNVVGVVPCVENMPSGTASRPGDVVTAASGKTVEIVSTDAEGRLILADAVWYADEKLQADRIIDIATLTGAASVALGEFVAGIVANDQDLCDKVLAASRESGEKCWQMPAFEEFKEYNKSEIADVKNSGGRFGGMITGGLFIGEFTDKLWVHIDIGNTVAAKKTGGYNPQGATGFGVRLLVALAGLLKSC